MSRGVTLIALLVVACGTPQALPTTSITTTVPATTVAAPQQATFEMEGCTSAPPRAWAVLCRAYHLVTTRHVDNPEPAALAAAAVAGVQRLGDADSEPLAPAPSVRCMIPHLSFEAVCEAIAERHHIDGLAVEPLVEAAVQGMFRLGLDPFSAYVVPDFADRLDALGSGQVLSLGVIVGTRDDSQQVCGPVGDGCALVVLAVFEFAPAERAGIVAGDVITEIDGVSTQGVSEAEAVAALHGAPGTSTQVGVDRPTGIVTKELVHEDIRYDVVEYGMLTPDVAYVRLNDFSQDAARLFGQVLMFDEVAGASALVLDLRDNPGGLVMSARAVASQFLHDGLVLVEETRDRSTEVPIIPGGLVSPDVEVVVLTNRGSASAAEVVAAALQGRGRGVVVGEPTFGKDLIQEVFRSPDGGEFRISTARWTGPDGGSVGVVGLVPDVFVEDFRDGDIDEILFYAFEMIAG
jgi:carboxyl-terminal processing protease